MMRGEFLREIDWTQPWLAPLAATGDLLARATDWRAELNALAEAKDLHNHRGLRVRFVPQADLTPNTAYEAFISQTGCVPTRDNLHDFFNALVWLSFPQIKVRLNALQAAGIADMDGVGPMRGKLRDAATIFDENVALLVTHDVLLLEDLRAHRWQELFMSRRDAFGSDCEVCLFGHALMEKLVHPYKAITAHAYPVIVESSYFALPLSDKHAWLDQAISRTLSNKLTTADFTPLPVLGIPGWCEDQGEAFYADATVFRPARVRETGSKTT
nr:DUF3025 domain-containing protein [Noviherbaspirillum sp.]